MQQQRSIHHDRVENKIITGIFRNSALEKLEDEVKCGNIILSNGDWEYVYQNVEGWIEEAFNEYDKRNPNADIMLDMWNKIKEEIAAYQGH